MKLGAVFPQAEFSRVDPDELVSFVQRLEAAGYDHLLVYDHVVGADRSARPGWTGFYDSDDPFLEPLVLFAYLARSCTLEFVTDVMILPQRQTVMVAKQVGTLAALAPGRIRLGVGLGWNDVEYDALGIDFRTRGARMDAQIPLLRRLFTDATVDHDGGAEVVVAAGIAPRPPEPVPIWIGSGGDPRALARVGRLADGWLPMPQIPLGAEFDAARSVVHEAAVAAGRDPASLGLEGHVWLAPGEDDRVADRMARWRDAGADAVALNPLRGERRWPDEHLDALLRAADAARPVLG